MGKMKYIKTETGSRVFTGYDYKDGGNATYKTILIDVYEDDKGNRVEKARYDGESKIMK